jgi:hypothetical protein
MLPLLWFRPLAKALLLIARALPATSGRALRLVA